MEEKPIVITTWRLPVYIMRALLTIMRGCFNSRHRIDTMTTYGTRKSRNCAEKSCSNDTEENDDKEENGDGVRLHVT